MKFLALETDINVFRNEYLIEGEEELLVTHFHWLKFITGCIGSLLLVAIATAAFIAALAMNLESIVLFTIVYAVLLFFLSMRIFNAFISYRYSYLIVTTEKIVEVRHESLIRQVTNPMHLDSVISTDVATSFFGLFNTGTVVVNLTERTKYSSKRIEFEFMPEPNMVAGIIENAIVISKRDLMSVDADTTAVLEQVHEKAEEVTHSTPLNNYDDKIS